MITFDRDISPLDAEVLQPKPFIWHIQLSGMRGGYYRLSWEQLLGFCSTNHLRTPWGLLPISPRSSFHILSASQTHIPMWR